MLNFTVTCKTDKCDNGNIAIEIESEDEQPIVVCGVCSQSITDIIPL